MAKPEIVQYRDTWLLRDEWGDTYRLAMTGVPSDPVRITPERKWQLSDGPRETLPPLAPTWRDDLVARYPNGIPEDVHLPGSDF